MLRYDKHRRYVRDNENDIALGQVVLMTNWRDFSNEFTRDDGRYFIYRIKSYTTALWQKLWRFTLYYLVGEIIMIIGLNVGLFFLSDIT